MRGLRRIGRHKVKNAFSKRGVIDGALALADWLNPVISDPAAPLKTQSFFDSFQPSLMPRSSLHQGMAAGLSVLAAELVGGAVDTAIRTFVPSSASYASRMGARVAVTAAGWGLTQIPIREEEATSVATVRTIGRLAMAGGVGGMIYESGVALRHRYPSSNAIRPMAVGVGGFAGGMLYSERLLDRRTGLVKPWSDDDKPAKIAGSFGIALGVTTVGRAVGKGFIASRNASMDFFGPDPLRRSIGRVVNVALWGAGAAALYSAGVGYIARSNEKIEPAYSNPPESPYVSGGPTSRSPFEELGLQGRRYVTDVMTPEVIEETLGEPAVAHPVRAYVGYNSEPLFSTGRSEMALEELDRLGAFDRKYMLLFSPTGTGWVDQTMIECAEIFARGDIATCCIQYGRSPSFLAVQKVALGQQQFRQLLWGVTQRLAERAPEDRPKVLVFGESLGAWSSSDVVMHRGIEGFDHYGIDRALWFGLPGLAKWSKNGMRDGSSELVPPGTVAAFDRYEQLAELSDEEIDRLRAVILDHDNDPIAQVSFRLAVKQPRWLDPDTPKGRNVPESMIWIPLLTFIQVAVDAMNAMRVVPGEFKSFGHDYRGDTARFVHTAYRFDPVSEEQMLAVDAKLKQLELERGERIAAAKHPDAETGRTAGPKYIRDRWPEGSSDDEESAGDAVNLALDPYGSRLN